MEAALLNCSASVGDLPVHCSQEVLLPFIMDDAVQAAMDPDARLPDGARAPTELRLVLLGRRWAGKSAAGNAILGGAGGFDCGKPTEECVARWADVAGRKITVVDTPGWEWYYPLNSTPDWVRRETLRSATLCPPGPHAVLLVMRSCASVTEDYVREMEEHLEVLGKAVWDHTMLLFTRGDELGLASMGQRIAAGGPALQGLVRKCGGRYHVVGSCGGGRGELMAKLEDMAAGDRFLEADGAGVEGLEAERKRRAREQRKKQRQMEEHIQTVTIKAALMNDDLQGSELEAHQSFSKVPRRFPEVRLVLLGERETGKSSAGNSILGGPGYFRAGAATEECARRQAEVGAKLVTVVDTPGWEAGAAGGTMERVKREIASSVGLCPPGPHALLLTLRVDALVASGHVRDHLELLSPGAWRHAMLLFTHGDQLREGVDIQQHIQGGGRDLQWLLEKCGGRHHVVSSPDGGGRGQGSVAEATELLRKVEKMEAMNRCEAFSALLYEVRALSRQKNERFRERVRTKDNKILQLEAQLKIREQVRSSRWNFEWKKKRKPPKASGVQREEEEEEDGRGGEQRSDYRELEEKIQWLAEDKEREIQDLSVEKERIRVALSRSQKEGADAAIRLELRRREVEELEERLEEQRVKLLSLEKEQERKRGEAESAEATRREWTEMFRSLKAEAEERETRLRNAERERDEAKAARAGLEAEVLEKERREEELKREARAALEDAELRERRAEEMKSQHEAEVERVRQGGAAEVAALRLQHQEEMDGKSQEMRRVQEEHRKELEAIGKQQREKEREVEELKRTFANQAEREEQAKARAMRELEERHSLQIQRKVSENKENEMNWRKEMREKLREKEEEIERLKQQRREEAEGRVEDVRRFEEQVHEMEEELKKEYADKLRGVEEDGKRQLKEMSRQFEREMEKQLQEIQKREKHGRELEERATESERAGAAMAEEHRKSVLLALEERDARADEVKRAHAGEIREIRKENERMAAALREEAERSLMEKETELEEVKLGLEEMNRKLRRAEAERREAEEKRARERGEAESAKERLEQQLRRMAEERQADESRALGWMEEKERVIGALNQSLEEREREEEENREKQGRVVEEMRQLLEEKEREREDLKHRAERSEAAWTSERRRRESEAAAAAELADQAAREIAEARRLLAEREREASQAKAEAARYAEAAREQERSLDEALARLEDGHAAAAKAAEELREREEEIQLLRRRDAEKEKELALLRMRIEQTKSELGQVSSRMEEETTRMIQEYEREIQAKSRIAESLAQERDCIRRNVERLWEEKEEMRREEGILRVKLTEAEERRRQAESREEDLREREAQIRELKETREAEIRELGDGRRARPRREAGAEGEIKAEILKREREAAGRNEEVPSKRGSELAGGGEADGVGNRRVSGTPAGGGEYEGGGTDGEEEEAGEAAKAMGAEVGEGEDGTERKKGEGPRGAKVVRDSRFLSEGRGHGGGAELSVMVLGEPWSRGAPDGVAILSGGASERRGAAGRRLSVVEPVGLKWRNGPGTGDAAGRRGVLDAASRRPPDVVLLLLPAFLTCTASLRSAVEEHAGWLGAGVWRRALLLFTWGETLGESVEQHVLRNGELRALVEKCEGRYHVVTSGNNSSMVEALLDKMEDVAASNRC